MSYRNRLAIFLGALTLVSASGCQDDSPSRGQFSNVATTDDSTPIAAPPYDFSRNLFRSVPDGAVVSLELDKTEYLLGENVLVHYALENTSAEPFQISIGGDYRGAERSLRYRVTATDENGKLVPDANPWAFCLGGLLGQATIKPGETRIESLALLRYCKFDKPGRYKIRVEHDLGWREDEGRKRPFGEATITFKMPTARQAERLVAQYERMPVSENNSMHGRKAVYADFSVLRQPVYLQPLTKRAERGFQPAITGIGNIETQAATAVLIDLLDHKDEQIVLLAAYMLNARLPDPQFEGQLSGRAFDASEERREQLANATWNSNFAESIRAQSIKLISREKSAMVSPGAFMLQCIGTPHELPAVIAAMDRSLAGLGPRQKPEDNILSLPGGGQELLRAMHMLVLRGATIPEEPRTVGEILLYLDTLAARADFRPPGWPEKCVGWLNHDSPFVREAALHRTPLPLSAEFKLQLPKLFSDIDCGVQRAACQLAQKTGDRSLAKHVLHIFAETKHHWVLNAARNAAMNLGARADVVQISAQRMHEPGMLSDAMTSLVTIVQHHGSQGGNTNSNISREELLAIQRQWLEFLETHFDEIQAGKRYEIGDPALKPELFGRAWTFYIEGQKWPPMNQHDDVR